jgi:hypothetical protein
MDRQSIVPISPLHSHRTAGARIDRPAHGCVKSGSPLRQIARAVNIGV